MDSLRSRAIQCSVILVIDRISIPFLFGLMFPRGDALHLASVDIVVTIRGGEKRSRFSTKTISVLHSQFGYNLVMAIPSRFSLASLLWVALCAVCFLVGWLLPPPHQESSDNDVPDMNTNGPDVAISFGCNFGDGSDGKVTEVLNNKFFGVDRGIDDGLSKAHSISVERNGKKIASATIISIRSIRCVCKISDGGPVKSGDTIVISSD